MPYQENFHIQIFHSTKGSENEDDSSTTIGCSVVRDLQPIDPIITITGKPSNTEANNHNPPKILELDIEKTNSSKINENLEISKHENFPDKAFTEGKILPNSENLEIETISTEKTYLMNF